MEILFERNDQKDCSEKPGRRQRPEHFKNHHKKTEGFALRIEMEILFEWNDQKDWSGNPGRRQRPKHFKNHHKKTRKVCVKD
jgi:hypothetical protein